jgi:hypothetical protein
VRPSARAVRRLITKSNLIAPPADRLAYCPSGCVLCRSPFDDTLPSGWSRSSSGRRLRRTRARYRSWARHGASPAWQAGPPVMRDASSVHRRRRRLGARAARGADPLRRLACRGFHHCSGVSVASVSRRCAELPRSRSRAARSQRPRPAEARAAERPDMPIIFITATATCRPASRR